MKKRVYIETSVISVLTARPSRSITQAVTKRWWQTCRPQCDVFVSRLVDREIGRGDADAVRRRQEAVAMLPWVEITDEVDELAERLLLAHALPSVAKDDATHVALAAVYKMDILLTWNCRHIANDVTEPRIRTTIVEARYNPPDIMTPADFTEKIGDMS